MSKRDREQVEDRHSITMANCLMLLSRGVQYDHQYHSHRVFECKTCNRQFPSFQALGGHRASHKKPARLAADGGDDVSELRHHDAKAKTHECSICGLEFAIGQALGGHMRRHRADNGNIKTHRSGIAMSSSSSFDSDKVVSSNKRKRALVLDLNLTPFENDLEFLKIGIENSALSV